MVCLRPLKDKQPSHVTLENQICLNPKALCHCHGVAAFHSHSFEQTTSKQTTSSWVQLAPSSFVKKALRSPERTCGHGRATAQAAGTRGLGISQCHLVAFQDIKTPLSYRNCKCPWNPPQFQKIAMVPHAKPVQLRLLGRSCCGCAWRGSAPEWLMRQTPTNYGSLEGHRLMPVIRNPGNRWRILQHQKPAP